MSVIDSLLAVIYPEECAVCGTPLVRGEKVMCMQCRTDLPVTNFHLHAEFNPLVERLMCHAPIERAVAMFHYERFSPYARLIHQAKYNGRPSLARHLAMIFAMQLRSECPELLADVDLLQPVPLSLTKLISRGYNQSFHIARGIAEVADIAVGDRLRARRHSSQTRKDHRQRYLNALGTYSVKEDFTDVTHVLLIDDIITTGATICACAEAIHQNSPATRISVLSLAATRLA